MLQRASFQICPSKQPNYAREVNLRKVPVSLSTHVVAEAASSSGRSFEDVTRAAKHTAARAGKAASHKLKETYFQINSGVKHAAHQVNLKFDVTGKAQHAASQVSETAKNADGKFGVRRKLRNLASDVQRKWPSWQRSYMQFSKTLLGQAIFMAAVFLLFYTGLAFKILNVLFILWWLTPFLMLPFSSYINKQARVRQKAEAQRRNRIQEEFFRPFSRRRSNDTQRKSWQDGGFNDRGKVIDVECETIDEH